MKINTPVTDNEVRMKGGQLLVSKRDLKVILTYCNPDFIEISGFSEAKLIGKNHNVVRHPDMPRAAFEDLWNTVKSGRPWTGYVKNRCRNGDYYWVYANVTPLRENGRITEYMSVRTRPTRQQINEAESLYQKMNEGSSKGEPLLQRLNLIGRMSLSQRLAVAAGLIATLVAALLVKLSLQVDSVTELTGTYVASAIVLLLALGGGAAVIAGFRRAVSEIGEEFIQLTQGNYKRDSDVRRHGEVGDLLRGL